MIVISDASGLIALEQIGQLELLRHLFALCLITPAIAREISTAFPTPDWLELRTPNPAAVQPLLAALDPGESEAIELALKISPDFVLLDERAGRRIALRLGLPVTGVLGVLLRAKERGLITCIRPLLDDLARLALAPNRTGNGVRHLHQQFVAQQWSSLVSDPGRGWSQASANRAKEALLPALGSALPGCVGECRRVGAVAPAHASFAITSFVNSVVVALPPTSPVRQRPSA